MTARLGGPLNTSYRGEHGLQGLNLRSLLTARTGGRPVVSSYLPHLLAEARPGHN
jgi:hypothetical protein